MGQSQNKQYQQTAQFVILTRNLFFGILAVGLFYLLFRMLKQCCLWNNKVQEILDQIEYQDKNRKTIEFEQFQRILAENKSFMKNQTELTEKAMKDIHSIKGKLNDQMGNYEKNKKRFQESKKLIQNQNQLAQKSFQQLKQIKKSLDQTKKSNLENSKKIEETSQKVGRIQSLISKLKFNRIKRPKNKFKEIQKKGRTPEQTPDALKYM